MSPHHAAPAVPKRRPTESVWTDAIQKQNDSAHLRRCRAGAAPGRTCRCAARRRHRRPCTTRSGRRTPDARCSSAWGWKGTGSSPGRTAHTTTGLAFQLVSRDAVWLQDPGSSHLTKENWRTRPGRTCLTALQQAGPSASADATEQDSWFAMGVKQLQGMKQRHTSCLRRCKEVGAAGSTLFLSRERAPAKL